MNTSAEIHQAAGGLVVSDPAILGGKPVFRGTRLPVETLFQYLADGRTFGLLRRNLSQRNPRASPAVLRYGQQRIEQELAV